VHAVLDLVLEFAARNLPGWRTLLLGGPPALGWALLCLYVAGRLKRDGGFRTAYSRKVFHFLVFGTAAGLQAAAGSRAVCLFGAMTSIVVLYAVARGPGDLLYEAMAREKDAPRRTFYILVPYFTTLLGGVASSILFGPAAVAGYLVAGAGDAIGEPAGARFGRRHYPVPSFGGVRATRTVEGSVAVFLASGLALVAAGLLSPSLRLTPASLPWIPMLAAACALLEAVSPHGWDNATMQIVPSFLAAWLLGGG
jgi:phytol kinase